VREKKLSKEKSFQFDKKKIIFSLYSLFVVVVACPLCAGKQATSCQPASQYHHQHKQPHRK